MGGALGTLAGAAIGSIVPGVGTMLGASLGGAAGSLVGGGGGSLTQSSMGTQQNSASTPNVPSWMLPYLQQNASSANSLAARPYQPYTGQQVAGLTGMQNQAGQLSQQLPGVAQQGFQQANQIQSSVANQGLNGLNPQTIQNYMNPYTQQVMNASNLRQQQQYQLESNQLQAQQGQTGAFGGSRSALAQGQLYNNFSQQLSQNEATSLSNNFTNAENMAMQGMGQANTAASGIMQGAAGSQTASLQNIGALQTAGGLEQTTNQNNLNAQYQNYLTAQAYPYQQLQNSQNILNPIASLTTGTNATGFNQQTGSPSIAQSAIGLGLTGAALNNSGIFGNSGSSGLGFGNLFSNNINSSPNSSGSYNIGGADTSIQAADMSGLSSNNGMLTGLRTGGIVPGYMNGGMIAHSMYSDGGAVSAPSWKDGINHVVSSFTQHFESGGLVQTTIPGIPTKYGIAAHETPYTDQRPKYLTPAYAKGGMVNLDHKYHNAQGIPYTHMDGPAMKKGGQIPLQTGLTNSGIGGIKRERQHWGQPYVPMDKAAQGYLRPNVKNAFSHGGLVAHYGVPHYDTGGSIWADTNQGDPIGLGAISADMAQNDVSADSQNQPSLVDAMLNKAKSLFSDQDPVSSNGITLPTPRPLPDAIPDAGGIDSGKGFDAGSTPSHDDGINDKINSLFKSFTGSDTPSSKDPSKEWADAVNSPSHKADVAAGEKEWDANGIPSTLPPSTSQGGIQNADQANAALARIRDMHGVDQANATFAKVRAMNGKGPVAPQSASPTTAINADALVSAPVDNKKLSPDDVQEAVMKRIMDRQSSGINLPLLSMGAAILGDRSNSLMGALGSGEKAYVGTSQEQNKSDLDALHQMAMSNYYGAKAASTNDLTGVRKSEIEAKTQRELQMATHSASSDPKMAQAMQFYKADRAAKPFDDETTTWENAKRRAGITSGASAPSAPQVGTVVNGYQFNGGDPSQQSSWSKAQ